MREQKISWRIHIRTDELEATDRIRVQCRWRCNLQETVRCKDLLGLDFQEFDLKILNFEENSSDCRERVKTAIIASWMGS